MNNNIDNTNYSNILSNDEQNKLKNYYLENYCDKVRVELDKPKEGKIVKNLIINITKTDNEYQNLPFSILNQDERCEILKHILEKTDQRQLVSNMLRDNIDNIKYFDFIIRDEYEYESSMDHCEISRLNQFNLEKQMYIRNPEFDINNTLNLMLEQNAKLEKYFIENIKNNKNKEEFIHTRYIKTYTNFSIHDIMQFVNYKIINFNYNNKIAFINNIIKVAKDIDVSSISINESEINAKIATKYFAFYRTQQSKFSELAKIYDVLINESKTNPTKFSKVKEEFKVEKTLVEEIDIEKLKPIILENETKEHDFEGKIQRVKNFINIMSEYASRNCCENSPQDLKVYFREIYVSNVKYNGKIARTIVNEYLERIERKNETIKFDKESHYMFIRTKISRGYMREKNLLVEYEAIIQLEKILNEIFTKAYLFYDFNNAISFIHDIQNTILMGIKNNLEN